MGGISKEKAVESTANAQHVGNRGIGTLEIKGSSKNLVGMKEMLMGSDIDVGANVALVARSCWVM
jgi:hypothetical protein